MVSFSHFSLRVKARLCVWGTGVAVGCTYIYQYPSRAFIRAIKTNFWNNIKSLFDLLVLHNYNTEYRWTKQNFTERI